MKTETAQKASANVEAQIARYFAAQLADPETKYELVENEIIKMAGGKYFHGRLGFLLAHILENLLPDEYLAHGQDVGAAAPDQPFFAYPDASVARGRPELYTRSGFDFMTNPVLVAEVLSRSTRARDRNQKSAAYRQIPALENILLLEQTAPRVEIWARESGGAWQYTVCEGMDEVFPVLGGAATLQMAELYKDAAFGGE